MRWFVSFHNWIGRVLVGRQLATLRDQIREDGRKRCERNEERLTNLEKRVDKVCRILDLPVPPRRVANGH